MNIHWLSVLKAAGLAAAAALALGILSVIPLVGPFIFLCYCLGGFLIPIGAGLLYGAFAPGEEDMGESTLGGALSGGSAGILYGFILGLGIIVVSMIDGSEIGPAITAGAVSSFFSICGFTIAGFVFGAVGGILWPTIQSRWK